MPKRRMSSRRRAQIKAWQLSGARSRQGQTIPELGSYSDPGLEPEKLGWSHREQRTIKYMGKNALKHSGGVSESRPNGSVTIAPWAASVIKGEKPTASRLMPDPSTLRGDMVQKGGSAMRLPRSKKVR